MRGCTLVWIDAREAVIARWLDGRAGIERMESDVPAHHRGTGHVRYDPGVRHGGGGRTQTAGEPNRLEHLERFVEAVAERLDPEDDLLILGPGTVFERLERLVCESDKRHQHARTVSSEASSRRTDRQLVARLRRFAGVEPRARTVGAYRWSDAAQRSASGQVRLVPRRVIEKPPHPLDRHA